MPVLWRMMILQTTNNRPEPPKVLAFFMPFREKYAFPPQESAGKYAITIAQPSKHYKSSV